MKRLIGIVLAIQLIFLTGCSFPFFGKSSGKPSGVDEGQKMVKLEDEQKINDTGTAHSDGSSVDAAKAAGNEIQNMPAQTDVAGVSMSSAISSATASEVSSTTAQTVGDSTAQASGDSKDPVAAGSTAAGSNIRQPYAPSNALITSDAFTEARQPVTVYYQDKDGCLVPMTRWILRQQGIARAAVSLCIDSAIAREELAYYGVYPVIPADTEISGIDIRDGVATIDFNRHLLDYNSEITERNIVASIVYALTEFRTVDKVRILVNGYTQGILKYGTDISGALEREDVNINTNMPLINTGTGKVDIFMLKKANEGFTYIVPVSVQDAEFGGELTDILVNKLLDEPARGSIYTEMPEMTELLDYSTYYDVLTLNFSANLIGYGGNTREEGILKQLAYTVRQVDGIKSLRILVDGKKVELPEGTDISSGLRIPTTINDVMDR